MSYISIICNCFLAVAVATLSYKKIAKLRRKSINKVLFSTSISGHCNDNDFSIECPERFCFKNNLGQIIRLIEKSQHSVCLALYTLNLSDVKEALKNANRRGVQIRIVTTRESMTNLSRDFMRLSTSGIAIRFPMDGTGLLHHKFCIVDGQHRDPQQPMPEHAVLLNGSMNWTMNSFTSNWDDIVVTSNMEFIDEFQKEFNSMWKSLRRKAV